jgi:hypothetical protein
LIKKIKFRNRIIRKQFTDKEVMRMCHKIAMGYTQENIVNLFVASITLTDTDPLKVRTHMIRHDPYPIILIDHYRKFLLTSKESRINTFTKVATFVTL